MVWMHCRRNEDGFPAGKRKKPPPSTAGAKHQARLGDRDQNDLHADLTGVDREYALLAELPGAAP